MVDSVVVPHVGDIIKTIPLTKKEKPEFGVILEVIQHEYPSVENHGFIAIKYANGNIEHYVHVGWEKFFKVTECAHG